MDRLYPFSRAVRQRSGFDLDSIEVSGSPESARLMIRSVRWEYRLNRRDGYPPRVARLAAIGLYAWRLGPTERR